MKVQAFFLCGDVTGRKKFPTLVDCCIVNIPAPSYPYAVELKLFAMVTKEPTDHPGRYVGKTSFIEKNRMTPLGDLEFFLTAEGAIEWGASDVTLWFEGDCEGRVVMTFENSPAAAEWPLRIRKQTDQGDP